jgi:hypothetical protein
LGARLSLARTTAVAAISRIQDCAIA